MKFHEAQEHYAPILSRLKGLRWFQSGKGAALCPQHDDNHASMTVAVGRDGQLLLKCMAKHGCTFAGICEALSIRQSDCFPPKDDAAPAQQIIDTIYPYTDEFGEVLYEAVRLKPKGFYQRRPAPGRPGEWVHNIAGIQPVPYNLVALAGASRDEAVVIVEGEKKVETLRSLGIIATCNAGGAEKWPDEWGPMYFGGRPVAIMPDQDEAGWKHAWRVARLLHPFAGPIRVVELPGLGLKEDVCDWLERRHLIAGEGDDPEWLAKTDRDLNRQLILTCVDATPPFDPDSDAPLKLRTLRMMLAKALAQSA